MEQKINGLAIILVGIMVAMPMKTTAWLIGLGIAFIGLVITLAGGIDKNIPK